MDTPTFLSGFNRLLATAALLCLMLQACSDSNDTPTPLNRNAALAAYNDPGIGEWETVPRDRLIELIGRILYQWPNLRLSTEQPVIFGKEAAW